MYKIFNQSRLKNKRYELRQNMTPAEIALWAKLRNKQLGVKFRRQHSIGRYVVDFYCVSCKLVIEVDGEVHQQDIQSALDQERDAYLTSLSLRVLRFSNDQVLNEIQEVINCIRKVVEKYLPC